MVGAIRRFAQQPQYNAPIDREGLGKGVQILFNPSVGPVDLATGRVWAIGGNASIATTQNGRAFNFDGVGDYYEYTGYPELTGNVSTFFMWCSRVGVPNTYGHVYLADSGATAFWQVDNNSVVYVQGTVSTQSIAWFNTVNRSIVLVTNGAAAGTKCYLDGFDSGLTWASAPTSWAAGSKLLRFGNHASGSSWDVDATIFSAGYENRAWSATEAKAFHESKGNALFKAPARRLWAVPAGGVSGSVAYTNANDTLSASGTTTVTGTLAKTNSNDTSAASGTTTVTGSLAATNANDTVSASGSVGGGSSGSVAYTNANDTSAASGTTTVTGSLAKTNANDTATASGTTGSISGTVAVTNANDTASASGSAGTSQGGHFAGDYRKSRKRTFERDDEIRRLILEQIEDVREEITQAEVPKEAKKQARAVIKQTASLDLEAVQEELAKVRQMLRQFEQDDDEELLFMFH